MLLSVFRSPGNTPLVTSFIYQDCSEFRLRAVIIQTYTDSQLTYLSEPETLGGNPIFNMMIIHFTSLKMYRYHVMFDDGELIECSSPLCHLL